MLWLLYIHTFSVVLSLQLWNIIRRHNKSAIDLSNVNPARGHKMIGKSTGHIIPIVGVGKRLTFPADPSGLSSTRWLCMRNCLTACSMHMNFFTLCMIITHNRVWINRVRLSILLVVSSTGKMSIPLSPSVPENLVLRDGFNRPVPRQPAHLHTTQAGSGAYLRDSSRVPRRRPFMKPPYAIGSVQSLSGRAIAYRWRSLPRVRRHRASKPQGSSERVLHWQVTMDQLIFASLSHTHYWYEVGMLKVPRRYSRLVIHMINGVLLKISFTFN